MSLHNYSYLLKFNFYGACIPDRNDFRNPAGEAVDRAKIFEIAYVETASAERRAAHYNRKSERNERVSHHTY